jgi:hypothetical protein
MSAAMLSSRSRAQAAGMFEQLMLPLHSVVNFFSPPAPASSFAPSPNFARAAAVSASPQPLRHTMVGCAASAPSGQSAAQILRSRRAQDGRIVISGRMRDVCAELDRLCSDPA